MWCTLVLVLVILAIALRSHHRPGFRKLLSFTDAAFLGDCPLGYNVSIIYGELEGELLLRAK